VIAGVDAVPDATQHRPATGSAAMNKQTPSKSRELHERVMAQGFEIADVIFLIIMFLRDEGEFGPDTAAFDRIEKVIDVIAEQTPIRQPNGMVRTMGAGELRDYLNRALSSASKVSKAEAEQLIKTHGRDFAIGAMERLGEILNGPPGMPPLRDKH
jgi:hypothetical protein